MCFLCPISRWSRKVASMLPWLVIPFMMVWAFSHLLPPNYRLEITSSRLACLSVLLLSLMWYEILVPWISSWRAHRSAMMRERKLIEGQEAAKRRKEATRRCRNCLTPYKIQMPGSGKYVCQYCGHISKRPVLEVAGTLAESKSLMSGPALTRSTSATHSKSNVQTRGPLAAWCWVTEINCSCPNFMSSYNSVQNISEFVIQTWLSLWKKLLAIGSLLMNRGGNQDGMSELWDEAAKSKLDKARRKSDKKKQLRLQKELFEAEDREQREEVARLVEEMRRERDEAEEIKLQEEKVKALKEKEAKKANDMDKSIEKHPRKVRHLDTINAFQESPKPMQNFAEVVNERVAILKGTSKDQISDFNRTSKMQRVQSLNRGLKFKNKADSNSRLSFLRQNDIVAQKAFASTSTIGMISESCASFINKADSMHSVKLTISSGSSNVVTKAPGVVCASDSAWNKTPWIKESRGLDENNGNKLIESLNGNGKMAEGKVDFAGDSSQHISFSDMPSLSPVRPTAIQPPIAPPSKHVDPLHQLFSTPSLFPPMELCANLNSSFEQRPPNELKSVFLSGHTFFESQAFSCLADAFVPSSGPPNIEVVPETTTHLQHQCHDNYGFEYSFSESVVSTCGCHMPSDALHSERIDSSMQGTTQLPSISISNSSQAADSDLSAKKYNFLLENS
ncbi:hypothetical protein KP509_10G084500 [Ceratopteris richardii]|uniref:Uncharacterized protein n=1 Tax=Ceratopteris richardii TaxID=49495 RepID=A0A8T2U3G1_CERRI|nr:hypothetical protein KP509_10G084500 [Ceratopteris richardii]